VKVVRRRTGTEWSIDSPEAGCGGCHRNLAVLFRTMADSIERNWNSHLGDERDEYAMSKSAKRDPDELFEVALEVLCAIIESGISGEVTKLEKVRAAWDYAELFFDEREAREQL